MCGSGMIHIKNKKINKNHGGNYKTIHYYACNNSRKSNGRTCTFRHTYNQEKIDGSVFETIGRLASTPEYKAAVTSNLQNQATVEQLEENLKQKRKELRKEELQNRKLGEELDSLDILADDYEKKYISNGSPRLDSLGLLLRRSFRSCRNLAIPPLSSPFSSILNQ